MGLLSKAREPDIKDRDSLPSLRDSPLLGLLPSPGWRKGRRSGLKIRRPKGHPGSSPGLGTKEAGIIRLGKGESLGRADQERLDGRIAAIGDRVVWERRY